MISRIRQAFSQVRKTWAALLGRDGWEHNLDSELKLHVELRAADLVRSGLSQADAERKARIEFGSRERYRDEARAAFGLRWLDDLKHDARYAIRTLRRSPGFAITAVVSMALGVGANTVVFSVVNSLLVRPLPVSEPERLVFVSKSNSNVSFPTYRDLRDRAQTIDGAIAYRISRMGLGDGQSAEKYWGYLATGNYFDVLGLQPVVGRFFHAEDEKGENSSPYAVLSYDLWQSRFHGDPQIPGQTVRVNAEPYTILGVAPRGFRGTELAINAGLWVPMMMQPRIEGRSWLDERGSNNCWMVVRAKLGVDARTVAADLNRIASDLAREHPDTDRGKALTISKPGLIGDLLRGPIEQFGMGVTFLAGLVLLAACLNLAALLGARSADRFREIALRVSIGAGRGRIVRQLLTESVVLTTLSGAAGGVLAWVLLGYLSQWRPPLEVPLQMDVHPDLRVFLFSAAVSILTGLVAGLAPAMQAWKMHTSEALKGPVSRAGRRWSFRDVSLFAQTVLCCVLVVSSVVAARGLSRILTARPGIEPAGVSVLGFDTALAGYSAPESERFQRRALDAVVQLPGVRSAAFAQSIPLSTDQSHTSVFREDAAEPRRLDQGWSTTYYTVSPGFFATVGTRLLAGRDYRWDENAAWPMAIVNETFARRMFGTPNAVGRHFRYFGGMPVEVIGIVEDGKYATFSEDPQPVVFRSATRNMGSETMLVVRSSLPESVTAAAMSRAVKALDPSLPVYAVGSMREAIALAFMPAQIALVALGTFGVLAVMLAVTGIYGLASYSVSRRVREIGIRMAIGARPSQVLRSVLGRLAVIVASGSVVGILLGLASAEVLRVVVYQASPRDPLTLTAVGAIMGVIALASALGPIRRAISIEPTRALRED